MADAEILPVHVVLKLTMQEAEVLRSLYGHCSVQSHPGYQRIRDIDEALRQAGVKWVPEQFSGTLYPPNQECCRG